MPTPGFKHYLRHVGVNIKNARQKRGLKQADIEEKIGLEYKHYQKIEYGQINVGLETLYRLAKLFKVSVSSLTKPK